MGLKLDGTNNKITLDVEIIDKVKEHGLGSQIKLGSEIELNEEIIDGSEVIITFYKLESVENVELKGSLINNTVTLKGFSYYSGTSYTYSLVCNYDNKNFTIGSEIKVTENSNDEDWDRSIDSLTFDDRDKLSYHYYAESSTNTLTIIGNCEITGNLIVGEL